MNPVRRRLASFFSDAARRCECEIFSLSDATFAILDGPRANDAEALANPMLARAKPSKPEIVAFALDLPGNHILIDAVTAGASFHDALAAVSSKRSPGDVPGQGPFAESERPIAASKEVTI